MPSKSPLVQKLLTVTARAGLIIACLSVFLPLSAAPQVKNVTLQLSWQHQFQFAGYYLADILGFYEAENIKVNILPAKAKLSVVDEVLSGRADFGIGNADLLLQHTQGKPVLAMAAICQHSPAVLIALKDSTLSQIQHLSGKRVMLDPGYNSLSLLAMLQQTDMIDKILRLDSSRKIEDLINGKTDLLNAYISNEPYLLSQMGIEYTLFDPSEYGIQFYSDILFTRKLLEQNDPKLIETFRSASLKGWRYAMDHPEKAIDLMTQHYPIEKDKDWLHFEANKLREMIVPGLVELGHMSKIRWEKISDQLALMGLSPANTNLDDFLYDENNARFDWNQVLPYISAVVIMTGTAFLGVLFILKLKRRLNNEVTTHTQAEQQSTQLTTHDPLTGLPNRLLFIDRLKSTLSRARREGNSPGLIFIDLDNFKLINDTYGHKKGDEALKLVVDSVQRVIRESDTLARLGGDEFTLLVNHCEEDSIEVFAKKILKAVQKALHRFYVELELGASMGLLVITNPMHDAETVLAQAGHLMYRAKFNGKNQIEKGLL